MKKYFVSYNWIKKPDAGFGCCEILMDKFDWFEAKEYIKKEDGYDEVVILFYKEIE